MKRNLYTTALSLLTLLITACNGAGNALNDPVKHEGIYRVTYYGNESTAGTVPDSTLHFSGDAITAAANTGDLTKDSCNFTGWNTRADGSGTRYNAGENFAMPNTNINLYAQWSSFAPQEIAAVTSAQNASGFNAVTRDNEGNIYLAGYITGNKSFSFGSDATVTGSYTNGWNIVVIKKRKNGQIEWAKCAESNSSTGSVINSMSCDPNGNVYAAGWIVGTGTFNLGNGIQPISLGSSFSAKMIIVKYNSSGEPQWAKSTQSGESNATSLAIASNGDFFVGCTASIYSKSIDLENSVIASDSLLNMFLVKYNSEGIAQSVSIIKNNNLNASNKINDIKIDAEGNLFLIGYFSGNSISDFGNGVTVQGYSNLNHPFLAKYNSEGVAQWAVSDTSTTANVNFNSLAQDSAGNIYVSGAVSSGTANFGNWVYVSPAYTDGSLFVLKYNSNGEAQWGRSLESSSNSSNLSGIAADNNGNIYVCGTVTGTTASSFGNGITVTGVSSNATPLLACYNTNGMPLWAKTVTSGSAGSFSDMLLTETGELYLAGYIGTGTTDFGNSVTATGAYNGNNAALVMYK